MKITDSDADGSGNRPTQSSVAAWAAGYAGMVVALGAGWALMLALSSALLDQGVTEGGHWSRALSMAEWFQDLAARKGYFYFSYFLLLLSAAYWAVWYYLTRCHLGLIQIAMRSFGIVILISVGLKAILDIDKAYDTLAYHLPFAGRLWGLVSREYYLLDIGTEHWYRGFPLMAEFFQGMAWWLTGRVEAANLVSFGSLLAYLVFLKRWFGVSIALGSAALLAVPFIQIHATSCYVDLPGNLAFAALMMIGFGLETRQFRCTGGLTLISAACAAAAVNTKHQLAPLVLVMLSILAWRQRRELLALFAETSGWARVGRVAVATLALIAVFATPLKNTVLYQNPFYPIGVKVLGVELNHHGYVYDSHAEEGGRMARLNRWGRSVFEIGLPWTKRWSIDAWNPDPNLYRLGGFSGPYVLFNLVLMACLLWRRWDRQAVLAASFFLLATCFAALAPSAHRLRYYMFWMVLLLSLNLYFLVGAGMPRDLRKSAWRTLGQVGIILNLCFLILVTKSQHVRPMNYRLEDHIQRHVRQDVVDGALSGTTLTIYGAEPVTFLYAAPFHGRDDYCVRYGRTDPGQSTSFRVIVDRESAEGASPPPLNP